MSADVCEVGIDRFIVVIDGGKEEEEKEGLAKVTVCFDQYTFPWGSKEVFDRE